jgi:hypothetical protein
LLRNGCQSPSALASPPDGANVIVIIVKLQLSRPFFLLQEAAVTCY